MDLLVMQNSCMSKSLLYILSSVTNGSYSEFKLFSMLKNTGVKRTEYNKSLHSDAKGSIVYGSKDSYG